MELVQALKKELRQELCEELCEEFFKEIKTLREEINRLHKENKWHELRKEINGLREEIDSLKENKREIYYQRFLEKMLGSGHNITKYGITDITTDTQHIEIKCWKNYKNCMGQLLAYNYKDTKQMIAAFYDEPNKIYKDKEKVIELLKSNNIDTWELIKTPYGIEIKKYQCDNKDNDFHDWLERNIQEKSNGLLQLKDICHLYLGKSKIHSHESTRYKNELEKWIKERYKNISWEYSTVKIFNKSYKGWKNLSLIEDDFYNWLEKNIQEKRNSILQLTDVCNAFLGKKVGPRVMTKYKKELEKYIKIKYKNLKCEYQKIDQKSRGWKDLCIKNTND